MSIRETFGVGCRRGRLDLDLSQQALAATVGIHRGYLANIEAGRANLTVDQMARIAAALGLRLELVIYPPRFVSTRPRHDTVHAWCSAYVTRRLTSAGWFVAREVELQDANGRGWIDILAFDRRTSTLAIIEIKTQLDDFGAAERQISWYERHASVAARRLGWRHRHRTSWLIALATEEVDEALATSREAIEHAFAGRADTMLRTVAGGPPDEARAIALIDPASHRSAWLLRTRIDGRRSAAPYRGYADAARRVGRRRRG